MWDPSEGLPLEQPAKPQTTQTHRSRRASEDFCSSLPRAHVAQCVAWDANDAWRYLQTGQGASDHLPKHAAWNEWSQAVVNTT